MLKLKYKNCRIKHYIRENKIVCDTNQCFCPIQNFEKNGVLSIECFIHE